MRPAGRPRIAPAASRALPDLLGLTPGVLVTAAIVLGGAAGEDSRSFTERAQTSHVGGAGTGG